MTHNPDMEPLPVLPQKLAYSIGEVVAHTGLSRAYIHTLLSRGELRGRKAGRRTIITHKALMEYLERE
jgi:excisionase family DNA binding protein